MLGSFLASKSPWLVDTGLEAYDRFFLLCLGLKGTSLRSASLTELEDSSPTGASS